MKADHKSRLSLHLYLKQPSSLFMMCPVLAWTCSLGSGGHNWSHRANPTQICLQLQTGSSQQTHCGKHDAALIQHKSSGNAFVLGFTSVTLPHYHFHWASDGPLSPPWWLTYPPPPATDTKGPVEYSQFWFRLCRQWRSIFPRGRRQLAWGGRRVWCHLGGTFPICHRVKWWLRWRRRRRWKRGLCRCGFFRWAFESCRLVSDEGPVSLIHVSHHRVHL